MNDRPQFSQRILNTATLHTHRDAFTTSNRRDENNISVFQLTTSLMSNLYFCLTSDADSPRTANHRDSTQPIRLRDAQTLNERVPTCHSYNDYLPFAPPRVPRFYLCLRVFMFGFCPPITGDAKELMMTTIEKAPARVLCRVLESNEGNLIWQMAEMHSPHSFLFFAKHDDRPSTDTSSLKGNM